MSEDQGDQIKDLRIANLFRADAPPTRDPAFRLKVLERREHRQFQRRLFTMLAGAFLIVLVLAFHIGIGGRGLATTGILSVGAALASAYIAFRGRLRGVLRRLTF